jgi:hypothetical protein
MDKTTGVTERLNASLVQGGSYVDPTALPGRTYKYWVKAVFNDGESAASNKCYVEIPGTAGWGGAMGPPQNLRASLVEGHVVLTWDPPATGTDKVFGYYVYRKDSEYGFDGQPLNDFAVTSCTWTDRTVQAGVTYWYHVTAVDRDENQSPPSEWVEVSTSELVIILTIDDHTALVNGQPVIMDQPPIIIDGRAMLPFRFISETMGIAVDWYEETRQVVATYSGTVVVFTIGSQTAYVNG